jgi:hypothetical protein
MMSQLAPSLSPSIWHSLIPDRFRDTSSRSFRGSCKTSRNRHFSEGGNAANPLTARAYPRGSEAEDVSENSYRSPLRLSFFNHFVWKNILFRGYSKWPTSPPHFLNGHFFLQDFEFATIALQLSKGERHD